MKKATYSFLAIAALMAMSCLKTEEFVAPEENTPHLQTFTAVIPSSPDTKVSLDNSGKTEWKINDKILIHGKYTEDNITVTLDGVTNTISADGKTATFTADLSGIRLNDTPGDKYYAVYPAEAYDEYSSGRGYHANCFSNTNTLLLSGRYNEAGNSFVFLNVTGALSFTVDGSSFGGFDEFKLVGKNEEVVGYTHFVTRARSDDQTFHSSDTSGEKTFVRADVNDDGTTLNYVYFPTTQSADTDNVKGQRATCVDFTGGFIIYFLNGGVITHQVSTSTPVRVERQGLVRLGDLTAGVKTYDEPEHHSSITGATDLSASQANSYVISAAGAYKFPALKGNSNESIGTVKGVEILWETYNNAESVTKNSVISKVDYEGSEVFFETPATLKPGNALIAAKDASDNILWSWHIWIPSTAITTDTYGIYNHELMDRYLGALVAATTESVPVESYGLTYQWGRKDPFVGAQGVASGTNAKVAGVSMSNAAGTITLAESIAQPTVYGNGGWGSWLPEADNSLWSNDSKTIYDPCPAGYRIPARNTSQPWHSSDLSTVTGWSENESAHYFTLGSPVTVFPFSGYRDEGGPTSINYAGYRACIWTSYASGGTGAGHLNVRSASKGNAHALSSTAVSRGGTIRCVKEEEYIPNAPKVTIAIDGNMSDWAAIPGASTPSNVCKEMKIASDDDNIYFYVSSAPGPRGDQLWGSGYYYFDFDLDNNPATGEYTEDSRGKVEAYMYLYLFGGSSSEPSIVLNPAGSGSGMTISSIVAKGIITTELIEIELSVPRSNLPAITSGQAIRFISWRSKDGTVIEYTCKIQ